MGNCWGKETNEFEKLETEVKNFDPINDSSKIEDLRTRLQKFIDSTVNAEKKMKGQTLKRKLDEKIAEANAKRQKLDESLNKIHTVEEKIKKLRGKVNSSIKNKSSEISESLNKIREELQTINVHGDKSLIKENEEVTKQLKELEETFKGKVKEELSNKIKNVENNVNKLENEEKSFTGTDNSHYFTDSLERNFESLQTITVDDAALQEKKEDIINRIKSLQKKVNDKIEEAIKIEESLGQSIDYERKCLKNVQTIEGSIEKIAKELDDWDGKGNPYFFEESLMRCIEKLDKIEPEGNENIRQAVRKSIKRVKELQDIFDQKVEEPKNEPKSQDDEDKRFKQITDIDAKLTVLESSTERSNIEGEIINIFESLDNIDPDDNETVRQKRTILHKRAYDLQELVESKKQS